MVKSRGKNVWVGNKNSLAKIKLEMKVVRYKVRFRTASFGHRNALIGA